MDDLAGELAVAAAKELVKAIVSGLVQVTRKVPALWRHSRPRQKAIQAELDRSVTELSDADEREQARQEGAWEGRLRDLLAERPELADEVRAITAELRHSLHAEGRTGVQVGEIRAGRDAYVAGHDQTIHRADS